VAVVYVAAAVASFSTYDDGFLGVSGEMVTPFFTRGRKNNS
jgi:hypothetical protein